MTASPYLTLTLRGLRALREDWLAQGKQHARELRLVVETFGQPVESHYHCLTYVTLKTERSAAFLYESQGPWIGSTYEHRARLWVEVTPAPGVTVANLYFRNNQVVTMSDSIFIPGPWIDELLGLAPQAESKVQARAEMLDERERLKLIEILGIGKIV